MAAIMLRTMSEAVKKGSRDAPPHALVAATPQPSNVSTLRQHHDDFVEPLALHGSDGDAGSEVLDADAEAEAEAAAAAAAEAAAFDCRCRGRCL